MLVCLWPICLTAGMISPEIMQAWEKAYGIIAEAFIGIEKDMYNEAGWQGYKEFTVIQKTKAVLANVRIRRIRNPHFNADILSRFKSRKRRAVTRFDIKSSPQ
jgi:hypothetical protein